ncbi:MAG: hypothetical protein KF729_35655 [Sandaracinaceae bacterium]|nr:hypothetical protein [Sandaracinaceae bacterium]
MDELLRLLAVVKRDLTADDVRAELGGRDPSSEHTIWAPMGEAWRVVAVFDAPLVDPGERKAKEARLRALLAPFSSAERLSEPPAVSSERHRLELDDELDRLAERTGARAALVVDERSPVVWGCSAPRAEGWDLDTMEHAHELAQDAAGFGIDPAEWLAGGPPAAAALREAGVDETLAQRWSHRFRRVAAIAPDWTAGEWRDALQIAAAIGHTRRECRGGRAPERVTAHTETWGVFAKGFAQIYLLCLVFDGPYSELHAEGPLVRALTHIETLVLALPPVDPPPRSAKVIAFRRP